MDTLGVFTLERDDLVTLSRRILACVPQDFLTDKEKPLVIAVDGTFKGGKKIVPDSGYEAAFDIEREDLSFAQGQIHDGTEWKRSFSEAGKDLRVIYRGRGEYDEYVIGQKNGRDLELSFVNVAWAQGFSFKAATTERERLVQHLSLRQKGGVVYVHNAKPEEIAPDISISIEASYEDRYANGLPRVCPDIMRVLTKGVGQDVAYKYNHWARYVELRCDNAALAAASGLPDILKDEFGFRCKSDMPPKLFSIGAGDLNIGPDILKFPLLKKHAEYVRAYAQSLPEQEKPRYKVPLEGTKPSV